MDKGGEGCGHGQGGGLRVTGWVVSSRVVLSVLSACIWMVNLGEGWFSIKGSTTPYIYIIVMPNAPVERDERRRPETP